MGGTLLNLLCMGVCCRVSETLDLFPAKGDEFGTLFLTIINIKIGILLL